MPQIINIESDNPEKIKSLKRKLEEKYEINDSGEEIIAQNEFGDKIILKYAGVEEGARLQRINNTLVSYVNHNLSIHFKDKMNIEE